MEIDDVRGMIEWHTEKRPTHKRIYAKNSHLAFVTIYTAGEKRTEYLLSFKWKHGISNRYFYHIHALYVYLAVCVSAVLQNVSLCVCMLPSTHIFCRFFCFCLSPNEEAMTRNDSTEINSIGNDEKWIKLHGTILMAFCVQWRIHIFLPLLLSMSFHRFFHSAFTIHGEQIEN